jgi:hypothetical protein
MDEPRNGADYGPPINEMRGILKISLTSMIDQVWAKDGAGNTVPRGGLDVVRQAGGACATLRRSALAPVRSRVARDQFGADPIAFVCTEQEFGFHNITGGSGLLAEHALRKLRLIRAAQRNHNRHIGSRGDICIRGIVPNS